MKKFVNGKVRTKDLPIREKSHIVAISFAKKNIYLVRFEPKIFRSERKWLVVTFLKLKNIQPATVVIASLKNAIPTGITTIVTIKKASDIRSQ